VRGGPAKFHAGAPAEQYLADEFMNTFNLYRLMNVDTEQMLNPMKRATLLLGFIKVLISDLSALSGSYGLRDYGP
jgi:hypothetical protein